MTFTWLSQFFNPMYGPECIVAPRNNATLSFVTWEDHLTADSTAAHFAAVEKQAIPEKDYVIILLLCTCCP